MPKITVAELIEQLKLVEDQSMPVVVTGFDESGFDDLEAIDESSIIEIVMMDSRKGWHSGQHRLPMTESEKKMRREMGNPVPDDEELTKVLFLG